MNGTATTEPDVAFGVSLCINVGLFLLFWGLFLVCRSIERWKRVYVTKKDFDEPSSTPIGWIKAALNVTDEEIEEKRGGDALMYLVVMKTLFFVCLAQAVFSCVFVAPAHAIAGGNATGIAMFSLANVPRGSFFFTVDLLSVIFNSGVTLYLFYQMTRTVLQMRQRRKRGFFLPENYTVVLREFPEAASDGEVRAVVEEAYEGRVTSFVRGVDCSKLEERIKKREKLGLLVEDEEARMLRQRGGRRKKKKVCQNVGEGGGRKGCGGCCEKKKIQLVDALEYYQQQFKMESEQIEQIQRQNGYDNDVLSFSPLSVAFVTFCDIATAQLAAQTLLLEQNQQLRHPMQQSWVVEECPAPETIQWSQLRVNHMHRWWRCALTNSATFVVIGLWFVPVAFASSLANIETLASLLPFLRPVFRLSPTFAGALQGFLPGLVLYLCFIGLVHGIVVPLAHAEGHLSTKGINRSVFNKYFLFLLINIFFGSIVASGLLHVLGPLLANPSTIVVLLATTIPHQVQYFLSYVMLRSLTTFGLELWRPWSLLYKIFAPLFTAPTKRRFRLTEGPYRFSIPIAMGTHCLIYVIIATYSTMNPLISPFGVIYFGLGYLTGRHNLIYVYSASRDEGSWFLSIHAALSVGLCVSQVVLGSVLGLSLFAPASLLVVVFIVSILVSVWTYKQMERPFRFPGIVDCIRDAKKSNASKTMHPHAETFIHPALRPPLFQLEDQGRVQDDDDDDHDHNDKEEMELWWKYRFESADAEAAMRDSDVL